jgi:hypothetical protein
MTKIKFGDQHDDSVAQHQVTSDGGESEIAFGSQYDRSKVSSRILDLKDPSDLRIVADELQSFAQQVSSTPEGQSHPEHVAAIQQAAEQAAKGDGDSAKKTLLSAGKWVLGVAKDIGTPVLVALVKSMIGL